LFRISCFGFRVSRRAMVFYPSSQTLSRGEGVRSVCITFVCYNKPVMDTLRSRIEGIIIDFDGTLAGVSHVVSPRVRAAIAQANDKVKISLCTGRPYKFVTAHARDLGLETLHVAEGGARVVDRNGKIYWEKTIDPKSVRALFAIASEEGMDFLAQIDGIDRFDWAPPTEGTFPAMAHVVMHAQERARTETVLARVQAGVPDVHAILTHYQEDEASPVMWGADITAADANKQHALLHLARIEGLDLKNFMAIGDGYNDFPLLMACGFKVAMGNAVPELKAIADYVAPTVDEDGMAEVIEKFVLHQ